MPGTQLARLGCRFHELGQQRQQRRMRDVDLRRMRYQQARGEVGEQRPLRRRIGSRGLEQQL